MQADASAVISLRSSSCLSPGLVVVRPFPSAFTTIAFDYSRRRRFGTLGRRIKRRGVFAHNSMETPSFC